MVRKSEGVTMKDEQKPSALVEIAGSVVTLAALGVIVWMMLAM